MTSVDRGENGERARIWLVTCRRMGQPCDVPEAVSLAYLEGGELGAQLRASGEAGGERVLTPALRSSLGRPSAREAT